MCLEKGGNVVFVCYVVLAVLVSRRQLQADVASYISSIMHMIMLASAADRDARHSFGHRLWLRVTNIRRTPVCTVVIIHARGILVFLAFRSLYSKSVFYSSVHWIIYSSPFTGFIYLLLYAR